MALAAAQLEAWRASTSLAAQAAPVSGLYSFPPSTGVPLHLEALGVTAPPDDKSVRSLEVEGTGDWTAAIE